MPDINITLPDSSVKTMPAGSTPQQVADQIGPGLARAVVVARVNSKL
ncbi:MAG: TGS domain-containing protein, partial [Planctomycetota bacterium]|nr:TGS domain-containing protein [Planctomycetota bacterium]